MSSLLATVIRGVVWGVAFLGALTVHEFAHGMVSSRLGDPTPKQSGRLTLNPIKHLDLLGTLAFFLAHIGWAKPVPVDPRYYRDPRRGLTLVGLAGPLANFTLAAVLAIPYRLGLHSPTTTFGALVALFLSVNVVVNISLGVFNLIPIPPLDGSKVLAGLLPPRYGYRIYQLESFGPVLLLLVIMTGAVDVVLQPLFRFFIWLVLGSAA